LTLIDPQGPAFLDAAVGFGYAVMRMVERGGGENGDNVYVRRTKKKGRRGKDGEEEVDMTGDGEDKDKEVRVTTFSLDAFEMVCGTRWAAPSIAYLISNQKFASAEIVRALLMQLARFRDLETDALRRVVSLLHRIAVRAKAEGLFFNVSFYIRCFAASTPLGSLLDCPHPLLSWH
jgi:replication fork protection complex subunit Tof1/Swi1